MKTVSTDVTKLSNVVDRDVVNNLDSAKKIL